MVKTAEKVAKYQPLAQEVSRLWDVPKPEVVPIIIGALGGLHKGILPLLRQISDINVSVLQQWALIGSTNLLRTVLHK